MDSGHTSQKGLDSSHYQVSNSQMFGSSVSCVPEQTLDMSDSFDVRLNGRYEQTDVSVHSYEFSHPTVF